MKLPRSKFLHRQQARPHCQPCRASQRRKPFRRGHYASSSAMTRWRLTSPRRLMGQWRQSRSVVIHSSRTGRARRQYCHRQRCVRSPHDGHALLLVAAVNRDQLTPMKSSISISFATSRRFAGIVSAPNVMGVNPFFRTSGSPRVFLLLRRCEMTNQAKINFASGGDRNFANILSGELFQNDDWRQTWPKMKEMKSERRILIPWWPRAPALTDLLGETRRVMSASMASSIRTSGTQKSCVRLAGDHRNASRGACRKSRPWPIRWPGYDGAIGSGGAAQRIHPPR